MRDKLKEVKIPRVVLYDVWSVLVDIKKHFNELDEQFEIEGIEKEWLDEIKTLEPQLLNYVDLPQQEKQLNILCRWLSRIFQKKEGK